jgi:hypothetical protein
VLTDFKVVRGDVAAGAGRYGVDLYQTWVAQPENIDKSFTDFEAWLAAVKSDAPAPDLVVFLTLAMD